MDLSNYTQVALDEMLPKLNLSEDERTIFQLLAKGKSIIQIADTLALSESTVNRRIRRIKDKIEKLESGGNDGYMIKFIKDGHEVEVSDIALSDKIIDLIVSMVSETKNESIDRA